MQILPIHTAILKPGDDLAEILLGGGIRSGDIIVVSSKAVATVEGSAIDLSKITPTTEAEEWTKKCGKTPAFRQAILDETTRLNGWVHPSSPLAMLTELKPDGFPHGTLLVPNAGLDESNIAEGWAIGWPKDPVLSAKQLRTDIEKRIQPEVRSPQSAAPRVVIIISDSCCKPRRNGVTAIALTVSGMDPLYSEIGHTDLFGKKMKMTVEARADQLATAANMVMGNAAQSTPAAIIRDHGITLNDVSGWVPGYSAEEDLFRGLR
jgi:coenzyme F420-0:L-glutamate ligase